MKREGLKFGRFDYAAFAAFTVYSLCSLAVPLMIVDMGRCLNFPLDAGGMSAGGFLQTVRSAFMVVTLLSCGLAAAWIGKRLSIGFSLFLCGAGMLGCTFSNSFTMLIPGLILAGLGEGVCEGLLTPFIHDLHPKAAERYVNIGHAFWSVGILCAVLGAGGLPGLGFSWRHVLAVSGLAAAAAGGLFMRKGHREPRRHGDIPTRRKQTRDILKEPRFWLFSAGMFFGAGAEFGLTFWSAAFMELTFGTGAFVSGLGTGAIAAGMFCGRTVFGYLARPGNLTKILLASSAGTIPLTLTLACLKPGVLPGAALFSLLFFLLFLCGIGIAPYWPTLQVLGAQRLKHCDPTLLYICFSAAGIPGCGFFSWLMGKAGDSFGTTGTLLVVPACLVVFFLIVLFSARVGERSGPYRADE
ncbi:MAG: MFS transporter [Lentisphaeria bacterium]|nr:MFS transporter [Lentisphaeria bacterium]